MKIRYTAVTLAVVLGCLQAGAAAATDVGVKGGVTRSQVTAEGAWSWGTGFTAGGFFSVPLFAGVRLQPEALVTRKATSAELGDGVARITSKATFDDLEFPILLTRAVPSVGRVTPVVYGGGFVGFNLGARIRSHVGDAVADEDIGDQVKRTEFGLVVGALVEVPARWGAWVADLRYSHGIPDVGESPIVDGWKTRSLALTAGIKWSRRR